MSSLDGQRHIRLYGPAFALWDVRDVEAHVRTLLDAKLREWGARLDAPKYDDALTFLVALCWRLSGLQADSRTPRTEWTVALSTGGTLGPFASHTAAEAARTAWLLRAPPDLVVAGEIVEHRPKGAFDPNVGLAFSTYSRRILSRRVVDWYRATFGDSRYAGNHTPVSLDQLVEDWDRDGAADSYLDHRSPGGRGDVVDELNRHAYYDPFEERETRSVTDQGGPDRVAAAR